MKLVGKSDVKAAGKHVETTQADFGEKLLARRNLARAVSRASLAEL
jgi:hypothetical protein